MLQKFKNNKKLDAFQKLEYNWNGYEAPPIPHQVINRVRRLVKGLTFQPKIFPTACKSIQLEYEKKNGDYLEIEITTTNMEVYRVISDNEEEFVLPFGIDKIEDLIRNFYNQVKEASA